MKGKLKQAFGKLSNNNLLLLEGRNDELIGRVQRRAGATLRALQHLQRQPHPSTRTDRNSVTCAKKQH